MREFGSQLYSEGAGEVATAAGMPHFALAACLYRGVEATSWELLLLLQGLVKQLLSLPFRSSLGAFKVEQIMYLRRLRLTQAHIPHVKKYNIGCKRSDAAYAPQVLVEKR